MGRQEPPTQRRTRLHLPIPQTQSRPTPQGIRHTLHTLRPTNAARARAPFRPRRLGPHHHQRLLASRLQPPSRSQESTSHPTRSQNGQDNSRPTSTPLVRHAVFFGAATRSPAGDFSSLPERGSTGVDAQGGLRRLPPVTGSTRGSRPEACRTPTQGLNVKTFCREWMRDHPPVTKLRHQEIGCRGNDNRIGWVRK
jgi:hypothetical protein